MGWLFSREVVVTLAVLGGVFSLLAMLLQRRPGFPPGGVVLLNRVAYVFMGASIALFILAGLLGKQA